MRFADFSVLDKIPGVQVQLFSEDMLPVCRSSSSQFPTKLRIILRKGK